MLKKRIQNEKQHTSCAEELYPMHWKQLEFCGVYMRIVCFYKMTYDKKDEGDSTTKAFKLKVVESEKGETLKE